MRHREKHVAVFALPNEVSEKARRGDLQFPLLTTENTEYTVEKPQ